MKGALIWIKANPIAVAASVLCIASLVTLLVVDMQGRAFRRKLEERGNTVKDVRRLMETTVSYPSPDLDNPPISDRVTVNERTIEALKEGYGKMTREFRDIFDLAVKFNEKGHLAMDEGLFPDPGNNDYKLYDARAKYKRAFSEMMLAHSPSALYPRLRAGGPLPKEALAEELLRVETDYLSTFSFIDKKVTDLTEEERTKLTELKRRAAMDALQRHATRMHIYAQTDIDANDFPFEIGTWSKPGPLPSMTDIWDGQMGLWIQQDIVTAIGSANKVWDPMSNVLASPVKRLLKIELVPGYVGIDSSGGLTSETSNLNLGTPPSGEQKLPDDFSKSPTGRRSNTIYDVRHVWVELVIDFQRLPEILEEIAKTNFMSVLQMSFKDVDEFEAMRTGYLYGTGDVVEIRMLIETLWLREWTTRMMPNDVKIKLGIVADPNAGTMTTSPF